jgi:hypothetical protein
MHPLQRAWATTADIADGFALPGPSLLFLDDMISRMLPLDRYANQLSPVWVSAVRVP